MLVPDGPEERFQPRADPFLLSFFLQAGLEEVRGRSGTTGNDESGETCFQLADLWRAQEAKKLSLPPKAGSLALRETESGK